VDVVNVMNLFSYRYRLIHALVEKMVAFIAKMLPERGSLPVGCSPRRILVLKFGGMGEAVLARSLMDRLKERNPQISVDFLVEERTAETMTCGSRQNVFRYSPKSDGLLKAIKVLIAVRRQRYDAVLDFEQHSLLTALFTRATSAPIRLGFVPSEQNNREKMFTQPVQLNENESMWAAFVRMGRILDPGLPQPLMTVPLPVSRSTEEWLHEWWKSRVRTSAPVVAMHLGVGPSAQYRRWPVARFVELASAMVARQPNLTILLTGGKSERSFIEEFKGRFSGEMVEAIELGGIERTCAVLRRCDLLVSADTGIMHLAAAMATPTVGLFGPNTPDCWAPVGVRSTYVYARKQLCSPCINSYKRQIPDQCTAEREGACMWDIEVDDVLMAAKQVIHGEWLG